MAKNGTVAKWVLVSIAVAGIVWNAATLHNDVGHLETELAKIEKRFEKLELKLEKIHVLILEK